MRAFDCTCGGRLFIDSSSCVRCGALVGLCSACRQIVAPLAEGGGRFRCTTAGCNRTLVFCRNRTQYSCCNGFALDSGAGMAPLCRYCALSRVIPNLSIPENLDRWRTLEVAKCRVLLIFEQAGFPIDPGDSGVPLSFEFKADTDQPVYTGHSGGVITINVAEADPVERERSRVRFGEPHRTLVGHLRHELGHYVWLRLVQGRCEEAFRELFGDDRQPPYSEALDRYYRQGPPPDWHGRFISAYATMHPWEDFAETFNAYLDMLAVLDTASYFQIAPLDPWAHLGQGLWPLMRSYQQIGVVVNELNRDIGLHDLVPELFTEAVVRKLQYIHDLAAKQG